jgi:hypothetical protein
MLLRSRGHSCDRYPCFRPVGHGGYGVDVPAMSLEEGAGR